MPLTCPTDFSNVQLSFTEFIDCSTISINYDQLGVATVGFTVIASNPGPIDTSVYTDLTFGGINFTGFITNLDIRKIPGTVVYEHKYTLTGKGCRV